MFQKAELNREFEGKKILILGYGREGKSTFNFLLNHGLDRNQIVIADKSIVQEDCWACICREEYLQDLEKFDLIFKSAGIPYTQEILQVIDKVITQVQFFFDHYKGKVIAITASKGKTTMTSLVYNLLCNAGYRVKLVGNIWKAVLSEIDFIEEYDFVVIELSSYMLQTLKKQNFLSILWEIFPDHLDWHGGMEEYVKAKMNILEGSENTIVFNSTTNLWLTDPLPKGSVLCGKGTEYDWNSASFFAHGKKLFPLSDVQLLWEHNLRNMSAIVALADLLHIDQEVLHTTIKHFQPVRHRLQNIWTFRGITFYDDAISTTPDSTIAALKALWDRVETILLWGLDREYDFSELVAWIKKSQIKNIVFFPDTWEKIAQLLWEEGYQVLHTKDMQEAVRFSYDYTSPGKVCLLSTASPSYSVWKDFEEKGDSFQEAVIFSTKKAYET